MGAFYDTRTPCCELALRDCHHGASAPSHSLTEREGVRLEQLLRDGAPPLRGR